MKTKSIILSSVLLVAACFVSTSCEDMFTAENKLVTDDLTPQDTVYQMLGIIHAMQSVMDQSILLGEVRADLVDINSTSSNDLQELSSNVISTSNAYNAPANFYNVINNCNIYLAYVDSTLPNNNSDSNSDLNLYYGKEIIAAKCFRAWAYLELAKIYGQVPFVTEPVTTASAAEDIVSDSSSKADLVSICDWLINDLAGHVNCDDNDDLLPSYTETDYFIPVRLMLAELYLWRGSFTQSESDFVEAVRYYHDYLAFPNEERTTAEPLYSSWENSSTFREPSTHSGSNYTITVVPMDTIAYYGGTYTNLRAVFCAQLANNYYASVNPSVRLREISNEQIYCIEDDQGTTPDTVIGRPTLEDLTSVDNPENYVGDLRYSTMYSTTSQSDMYHSEYSKTRQVILKYSDYATRLTTDVRIAELPLFRVTTVYLHLAEALNRAGFPETAFCILKYGISDTSLEKYVSDDERERLAAISSVGFSSDAGDWDQDVFVTTDQATGSTEPGSQGQSSIHGYGCGSTWCNTAYYLPTDSSGIVEVPVDTFTSANLLTEADTIAHEALLAEIEAAQETNAAWLASDEVREQRIAALALMILDEEALELAYEGHRFYDLMRYSKASGNTSYLGEAVSKRAGEDEVDSSLQSLLSTESGWYLTLPE